MVLSRDFISMFIRYGKSHAIPEVYLEAIAYLCLSAVVGRKAVLNFGTIPIYPNIWVLLLGESSKCHKSTALTIGKSILSKVGNQYIMADDYTYSAMVTQMASGVKGLMLIYEFEKFIKSCEQDYNSQLRSFFTEIYDCNSFVRVTGKNGTQIISDPFVSKGCASTMEWMNMSNLTGGLLARYLMVFSDPLPTALPEEKDETLERELVMILQEIASKPPMQLTLQSRDWYKDFTWYWDRNYISKTSLFGGMFSRWEIVALKMAMLTAYISDTSTITREHLEGGVCLLMDCARRLLSIQHKLYPSRWAEEYRRVTDHIKFKRIITIPDLARDLAYPTDVMEKIVNDLARKKVIGLAGETVTIQEESDEF